MMRFLPITAKTIHMNYISVNEFAKMNKLSPRTVRHYCANGKIKGAFLTGKTWNIPEDSKIISTKGKSNNTLLDILREQKEMRLKGGIYHKVQVELTFNSNRIEGSKLTQDQTRFIFETNTIGAFSESINVDDIIETTNHFRCIDLMIDKAHMKLSESFIKQLHFFLKTGTSDSSKDWFNVGEYKRLPNEVGGSETCPPKEVAARMNKLLQFYHRKPKKTLEDIIGFHYEFEMIHPFQDGNGRVGRLIMFKECLANQVVPFIIDENLKFFYYRGLQEWPQIKEFLLDTCLTAQDNFKAILNYFEIQYE
ncbi:Fic/DOC family protein [Cecembia lonarensis LW9]|uniref:Fic/DOC family protein n=2 Tax=Cecembia TaxID=1187078 RepID=K1LBF9_CECL9|nr:Fic/DOC family protein [Cecembia lonarensis LW9]